MYLHLQISSVLDHWNSGVKVRSRGPVGEAEHGPLKEEGGAKDLPAHNRSSMHTAIRNSCMVGNQ